MDMEGIAFLVLCSVFTPSMSPSSKLSFLATRHQERKSTQKSRGDPDVLAGSSNTRPEISRKQVGSELCFTSSDVLLMIIT